MQQKNDQVYFAVTVDVECDRSPNWKTSSPVAFYGVSDGVGKKLHPLCQNYGIRPSYLLSHEVIADNASRQLFKTLNGCELGAHLHGDFLPPKEKKVDFAGSLCDDMQHEYSIETETAKMKFITEQFKDVFGYRPRVFRAGRFGVGHNTGKILSDLGYLVDASVTPHVRWISKNNEFFPDFRNFSDDSYFVKENGDLWEKGNGSLLEIPVTIIVKRSFPYIRKKDKKIIWMRPWYSSVDEMKYIIKSKIKKYKNTGKPQVIEMMFHNVELIAGGSPYPQTNKEVSRYVEIIEEIFEEVKRHGIIPATLEEIYKIFATNKKNDKFCNDF